MELTRDEFYESLKSDFPLFMNILNDHLSCTSHHLDHVFRVCWNSYKISQMYLENGSTSRIKLYEVLLPAAILHDIARVIEDTDQSRSTNHAILGATLSEKFLHDINFNEDYIKDILHCIRTHRFRTDNHKPETIEAKILFDADKIDALGAIGIARLFMTAGRYGQKLSSKYSLDNYSNDKLIENLHTHNPLKEYEVKLKNLHECLYTPYGKELALERTKFMDQFFNILLKEL